jgi:large subunit ribosomal protein L25
MLSLSATIRDPKTKTQELKKQGLIAGVLYGAGVSNTEVAVEAKDFQKIFHETGESSLFNLHVNSKSYQVLVHQVARDPITQQFKHIDFYHPSAQKEIEVEVPLVFEGESPAVANFNGVLVREIQEVKVKGLAHNLPREIRVNVSALQTFEDRVLVSHLKAPKGIEILRHPEDIVALVEEPTKEKEQQPLPAEAPIEVKSSAEKPMGAGA